MNQLFSYLLIVVAITEGVQCGDVSPVVQCKGENFEGLQQRIKITPCGSELCKLPKLSDIKVAFKFKPKHEVKTLVNEVEAKILGIPIPFAGVTGQSACNDIRRADTGEPTSCPLEPGIEYIYENKFPIHSYYPTVRLTVHWRLRDGDRSVICFEVPAAIVKSKSKKKTVNST